MVRIRSSWRGAPQSRVVATFVLLVPWVSMASLVHAANDPLAPALATLVRADIPATDQRQLQVAWRTAASSSLADVPTLFRFMSDAEGPLAHNWLRAAVDSIAERSLHSTTRLDPAMWESIARDRQFGPRARRVAFEWLTRIDPQAPDRLLPEMLDDPSLELRFDAVQRLLDRADALHAAAETNEVDAAQRLADYQRALASARDLEQIQKCAASLEKLGVSVDLVRQLGFVVDWRIVGPFDNTELKGFAAAYPPERTLDAEASYQGKGGEVVWKDYHTDHKMGIVNLNEALVNEKEVVAYALARIVTKRPQQVQLRLGSKNAPKIWFNGQLVGAYEAYHAGEDIDQYVAPVKLEASENTILVKLCQNEKSESWEQDWQFQLRVTDLMGGPADASSKGP